MSNENYSYFANTLRNLRKSNNYTQEKLAEKLGVSVNLIAMYENGNRFPSIKMLMIISNFFNVSIDELIGHSVNVQNNIDEAILGISSEEFNNLSPSDRQSIRDFINFIKSKKHLPK